MHRRIIHAADVPQDVVEIVADAVRLCRAADEATTAGDVLRDLQTIHPGEDAPTILRSAGYAAMLMDPTRS